MKGAPRVNQGCGGLCLGHPVQGGLSSIEAQVPRGHPGDMILQRGHRAANVSTRLRSEALMEIRMQKRCNPSVI